MAFFPSLKQNFIVYRSSEVSWLPDCICKIHQQLQSGFERMYSNSCFSCLFEPGMIKRGQSSQKMHSNNILNFQVSATILNACTKKSGNLLNALRTWIWACMCFCVSVYDKCICLNRVNAEVMVIGDCYFLASVIKELRVVMLLIFLSIHCRWKDEKRNLI